MIEQGSPEWFKQRLGKITASEVHKIIGKSDEKWTQSAINYMHQLCAELMLLENAFMPEILNNSLNWGRFYEIQAKKHYEEKFGVLIKEVGFKTLDCNNRIGASSDGLIIKDIFNEQIIKGIEIKCPYNPANYIKQCIEKISHEHYCQIQMNMMVHNLKEWDYVSYCPLVKEPMHVKTVLKDDDFQSRMLFLCERFLCDLDSMVCHFSII